MFGNVNANCLNTGDEDIDTGVAEIDAIETSFANTITVNFAAASGSGDFTVGEIVAGGNSNVTAEVKAWDSSNRQLQVFNRSGIFTIPETVTGQTSGAAWTTASYNTLNNVNTEDSIDQNYAFELADDDIIDFLRSKSLRFSQGPLLILQSDVRHIFVQRNF